MIQIDLKGCEPFVDSKILDEYRQKAFSALKTLDGGTGAGVEFTGWNTLPEDTPQTLLDECLGVVDKWIGKGVNLVVVIGIGGSYLGAKATIEALSHSFADKLENGTAPSVIFAGNNLSEDYLAEVCDVIDNRNAAAVVISKSGTTTEPAVAFRVIKQRLEKIYGVKEARERIVAVTDARKGALKTLSDNEGYKTFVIPDNVGGRFSVLTPVGLLPIAMAGFDIGEMVRGARDMQKQLSYVNTCDPAANPAIQYAAMRNAIYSTGRCIELFVGFTPKLQYVAEWWKQLYGESEGKGGKGIFPASVICTTDLHSMGQYIQDGERKLFETVVGVASNNREITISREDSDLDGLNYLDGRRVEFCNRMAQKGTKQAHVDGGVPNIEITVGKLDEYNLGQLFYFFEKACGISAYILGVNPFDQPGVEVYKKNMFHLLGKPGC